MPFAIQCTNHGCGKIQEPYLDPKTDKVFCSLCDKEMVNVSHFAKMQMKNLKQFKQKTTISFSVKCDNCGKEDRPIIKDNDVVCCKCLKTLNNLSLHFRNMLKESLKTADKDI